MAVAFRAVSAEATYTGSVAMTVDKPTGTVQDDLMLAVVSFFHNSTWVTPPAGWTLLHAQSENGSGNGFGPAHAIWWKKAGGSEPASYDFTPSASDAYTGRILSYSGADTTTPIAASTAFQTPSPTTSWAAQSISPSSAGMLVCFWGSLTGSGAITKPASMTQRVARAYDASYGVAMLVAEEAISSSGATGTRTATNSTSDYGWIVSIALGVAGGAVPVLSSPSATVTSSTAADVSVTTDTASGTLYVVVTRNSLAPNAATIKLGQNEAGLTAPYAGNQVVTSSGTKTFNASGLSAGLQYWAHFVHTSASGTDSSIVSSSSFTTSTGGSRSRLSLLGIG